MGWLPWALPNDREPRSPQLALKRSSPQDSAPLIVRPTVVHSPEGGYHVGACAPIGAPPGQPPCDTAHEISSPAFALGQPQADSRTPLA